MILTLTNSIDFEPTKCMLDESLLFDAGETEAQGSIDKIESSESYRRFISFFDFNRGTGFVDSFADVEIEDTPPTIEDADKSAESLAQEMENLS